MPDQPYYGDKYDKGKGGNKSGDRPATPEELQKIRDILKKNFPKAKSPYSGKGPNNA